MTRPLDPEHRERAAKEAAVVIEEIDRVKREQHFKTMNSAPDLAAALAGLKTEKSKNADLERKVSKLRSTIKYWQQQAKGRNR